VAETRVRPSAADIYESVKQDAAEELERPTAALAYSGFFAGGTVGFSGVAYAAATVALGPSHGARLVAALLYPIGFVAAIVGRAQLFTENTLYPVTLVLDHRKHLRGTARLWTVVFVTNVAGAILFAVLAYKSGALPHDVRTELATVGAGAAHGTWWSFFWSGVIAGWVLALVAWLVESSSSVSGQVVLIWALTSLIALVSLDHCVSTTVEVGAATIAGHVSVGHLAAWLAAVTLGNVVGGTAIVGVLNYGQVRAGED